MRSSASTATATATGQALSRSTEPEHRRADGLSANERTSPRPTQHTSWHLAARARRTRCGRRTSSPPCRCICRTTATRSDMRCETPAKRGCRESTAQRTASGTHQVERVHLLGERGDSGRERDVVPGRCAIRSARPRPRIVDVDVPVRVRRDERIPARVRRGRRGQRRDLTCSRPREDPCGRAPRRCAGCHDRSRSCRRRTTRSSRRAGGPTRTARRRRRTRTARRGTRTRTRTRRTPARAARAAASMAGYKKWRRKGHGWIDLD
jgi:hypothetical protein